MKTGIWKWIKIFALVLPLGLTACGKQTFDKQKFSASVAANQYITIKPKVDIILFQDVSASMEAPSAQLRAQLSTFVNAINSNWDFHFAVLPLQRQDDLRGRWILAQDCTGVSYCVPASQASTYASGGFGFYAPEGLGNIDNGFVEIQQNLSNSGSMSGSGFLRADAMLVVIPFTNGNDISGMSYPVDYKDRGDGQMVPNYASANAQTSFNTFKTYLTNTLKPSVSLVSFYSVAAGTQTSNPDAQFSCAGGTAWAGSRYINMALQVDAAYPGFPNGGAYDLCSGQLGSVLSSIALRMQDLVLAVEFNYIALPDRPVPGSLKIYKNGELLPAQTTANGWTLYNVVAGQQQYTNNKATSFAPYPGNVKSGYFIELHGNAVFKGSDQITYTYEKF